MILIKNARYILGEKILQNKNIIIENDKIIHIGSERDKTDFVIDGKNCIISPGLVNTHTHAAMVLLRGIAEDLPLDKWLQEKIWPIEAKLTKDDIYWGTLLACAEMIKSGTTSFIDMYFNAEEIAKATEKAGMRALICEAMFDFFNEDKLKEEVKKALKAVRLSRKYKNSKIQIGLGPHAPYTCSKNLLYETKYLAKKHGLKIQIHVSETRKEIEDISKKYKMRPIEFLESLKFLNKNVIVAHAVWTGPEEMKILKKRDVTVSHCPVSNMKLASGIAPITKMQREGINITLGTDGASSNNTLNMFETLKISALLQKVINFDTTSPNAFDVFRWSTINGGKFLGINNSLKEGSVADLILVDLKKPNLIPIYDPISHFIYSVNGFNVCCSIIGGEIVMENYELTKINEDVIYSKIFELIERFKK